MIDSYQGWLFRVVPSLLFSFSLVSFLPFFLSSFLPSLIDFPARCLYYYYSSSPSISCLCIYASCISFPASALFYQAEQEAGGGGSGSPGTVWQGGQRVRQVLRVQAQGAQPRQVRERENDVCAFVRVSCHVILVEGGCGTHKGIRNHVQQADGLIQFAVSVPRATSVCFVFAILSFFVVTLLIGVGLSLSLSLSFFPSVFSFFVKCVSFPLGAVDCCVVWCCVVLCCSVLSYSVLFVTTGSRVSC